MDVSVVIVNYNTLELTKDCIDSIFAKTFGLEFEVILVDNASTDGSKVYFENDKRINYIYSNVNLGFGKGNNLGYEHSKGKYIFFLNSDTLLLNNAIKYFYDYMESSSEKVGCCGCLLYDRFGKPMHSYANLLTLKYFVSLYLYGAVKMDSFFIKRYFKPKTVIYPTIVGYITGADIFMRRSLAEEMGLFDPDFFMYYEESEMQYRYSKAGYEMHCIDTAKIQHLEGGSASKTSSVERSMRFLDSENLYCKKTMSKAEYHIVGWFRLLKIPRIILGKYKFSDKIIYIKNLLKLV